MAGLHALRVNIPDTQPLSGDQCYCFICGQRFKNMGAYMAHRFEDGIYVRRTGCTSLTTLNARAKREG